MLSPEIRVINIHTVGTVHVPTPDDPESGILRSIQANGKPLFKSGEHVACLLPAVRPHHPNGSDVLWITKQSHLGAIAPWSDDSWGELAANSDFLSQIEHHVKKLREEYPKKKVYFFMGYVSPESTFDVPVYPRGLPSQKRAHLHESNEIDRRIPYDRLLNDADATLAALFLNEAGELSIKRFTESLNNYGTRFQYCQPVGLQTWSTLDRTMFGFEGLEQALRQSLALQALVTKDWISHAQTIAGSPGQSPLFPDQQLRIMQTPVPSMVIILPTEQDRSIGNTDNRDPVWTAPFSVTSPQSALTEGGVVFDYSKV